MSTDIEIGESGPRSRAFYDSTWRGWALVVGILVLLSWPVLVFSLSTFELGEAGAYIGVPFVIGFSVFLVAFPFLARSKGDVQTVEQVTFARIISEVFIAMPASVIVLALVTTFFTVYSLMLPDAPLGMDGEEMAASWPTMNQFYFFMFLAVVAAPFMEEIFFRGFLFNALRARFPLRVAIVLQAILFGFAHPINLSYMCGTAIIGLVLGVVYQWRKTILTPMLVHGFYNGLMMIGLFTLMQQQADKPMIGFMHDGLSKRCVIVEVVPNSPAEEAGLREGDVIVGIESSDVESFTDFTEAMKGYVAGDTVKLRIERDNDVFEVELTLKTRSEVLSP